MPVLIHARNRRPRLTLNPTQFDKRLEYTGYLLLVLMWGLTLFSSLHSPASIPVHFNVSGQADGYGSKKMLWILPIIGTIIYWGLTKLNKYPHIFNYPIPITEDNARRQYTIATRNLSILKVSIVLVFLLVILFSYLTSKGISDGLPTWLLPLSIGLLSVPTIISVWRITHQRS